MSASKSSTSPTSSALRAVPAPIVFDSSIANIASPAAATADAKPDEGTWLFKRNETIMGPVDAKVIVEKINNGEINLETKLGREVGKWRNLSDEPYFKSKYDAYLAEKAAAAARAARLQAEQRAKNMRNVRWALTVVIPLVVGGALGNVLMRAKPWDDSKEWAERAPAFVALEPKPSLKVVANNTANITGNPTDDNRQNLTADNSNLDKLDKNADGTNGIDAKKDGKDNKDNKDSKDNKDNKDKDKNKNQDDNKNGSNDGTDKNNGSTDGQNDEPLRPDDKPLTKVEDKPPEKLPESLTKEQINGTLSKAGGGIKKCVATARESDPNIPSVITLEFTITEEGKATNISLLERDVRGSSLEGCVRGVLKTLQWPRFTGERKNVTVPFKVSAPKPNPAPAATP